MNTAIVALGLNGLASTGALVYVVRRVSPWPKLPASPGITRAAGGQDKTQAGSAT